MTDNRRSPRHGRRVRPDPPPPASVDRLTSAATSGARPELLILQGDFRGPRTIQGKDYLGRDSQLDELTLKFIECAEQEALSAAQMAVVSAEINNVARLLRQARHAHLASRPELLPNDDD